MASRNEFSAKIAKIAKIAKKANNAKNAKALPPVIPYKCLHER
jgi:hypothetical protein